MSRIGQRIAAGVAQHVDVNLEREAGAFTDALDQPIDGIGGERGAALLNGRSSMRLPITVLLAKSCGRSNRTRRPTGSRYCFKYWPLQVT
jgi:hypothetical protein